MTLRHLLLGLLLLCWSSAILAKDEYLLEMIVFQQPDAQDEPLAKPVAEVEQAKGSLDSGGPGIVPLPPGEGQLGSVAYTLQRHGAQVLAHLRWKQDFSVPGNDQWMHLEGKNIAGAVRITKGRFIHVNTDLWPTASEYPIREHGRLRSGELYYIDHPRIGILVQAERLEEAPQPAPQPAAEEAPPPPPVPTTDENPPEERKPASDMPRALPDNS
ncbi:MAG: hypothetical protein D6720_13605 [Gammaproteobacteria bacterium]|nr:MAG: hypothetical protein D6720_13605 [Gammaproteobacteria bacterium]